MAELADAHGSGPCGSNTLRVRLPSSAGDKQEVRKLASCFFAIMATGDGLRVSASRTSAVIVVMFLCICIKEEHKKAEKSRWIEKGMAHRDRVYQIWQIQIRNGKIF